MEKCLIFFIFYNITISQLFPLDGFRFIFLLRDSENDLFDIFGTDTKIFAINLHLLSSASTIISIFNGNLSAVERQKTAEKSSKWWYRKRFLAKQNPEKKSSNILSRTAMD